MMDPEDPRLSAGAEQNDETVVHRRPSAAEPDAEATIVVPSRAATDSSRVRRRATGGGSVALPVDGPETLSHTLGAVPGLDPERRIGAVPGVLPWERGPEPERGVRAGRPVVYGARSEFAGASAAGVDGVHQLLGDPPPARPVVVRAGRRALPSVERRARRIRVRTLLAFAAVVVIAVAGLWGTAVLAFG